MAKRDDAIAAVDAYAADEAGKAATLQLQQDTQVIDQLQAENAALRAQLGGTNVFGMAVGPTSGAIQDDLANFKATVARHPNLDVEVRRSYKPGTATTWVDPLAGTGIRSFFSQKPNVADMASGKLDSWAATFAASCPDGMYLTVQHEPENPSKAISAAQFVACFDRWAKVTKQANPNVLVGPVFMEWQMRVQGNAYAYHKVDASVIDFWGFDAYVTPGATNQGYQTNDSCATLCTYRAIPLLKPIRDLPFVVAEIGVPNDAGVDRARWLTDGRAWAKGANTSLLYYQVSKWMLTDAELDRVT